MTNASAISPLLIDENTDLAITADYDPLIRGAFEDYIQISERENPGRQKFNNILGQTTRDAHVTGLVLYFGKDVKKSKLRALLDRNNLQNLSLYADTVVVDTALRFPQTHLIIHARRFILGEDGSIDISPLPFVNPHAAGGKAPESMKRGGAGNAAGSITLLVQSCVLPPGKTRFLLKGSDGQHGEPGGLRDRKPLDSSKVPVTWEKIKDAALSHDRWRGDESNWNWGDLRRRAVESKLYYVKLAICNNAMAPNPTKAAELGDEHAENPDNGRDAYRSGDGGNGGNGGVFRSLATITIPPACVAVDGGVKGLSEPVSGEKKKADSTFFRGSYNVCHNSWLSCTPPWTGMGLDTTPAFARFPNSYDTVYLTSRDGTSAQGKDGKDGARGKIESLTDIHAWLHPFVCETVVQYSRNAWLEGDRKPARWLLPIYQEALTKAQAAKAPIAQDLLLRNIGNDIDRMLGRVRENLDYFGNPAGWVPRLSALTNIDILKTSRPAIAKLLHYAGKLTFEDDASQQREKNLVFIMNELDEQIKTARDSLVSAQKQLPEVKTELDDLGRKLADQFTKVRSVEDKIVNQLKLEAQEQAIFTGACKVAAGLCHFIPVGQPFVGQMGSGLFERISEIDIHKHDPFAGMKTMGTIATDLGEYINTQKDELTEKLTSGLTRNINSAKETIDDLDERITDRKAEIAECKKELDGRFGEDVAILRGRLDGLRSARTIQEAKFYDSNEYAELVRYTVAIEAEIDKMETGDSTIDPEKKAKLQSELEKFRKEKKGLIDKVEKWEGKKVQRGKAIEKTARYLESAGKGISGVADGLQAMITPVDETSQKFRQDLERAKEEHCKKELQDIFEEIDKLNARRLKAAQRLSQIEATISGACQTLSTSLIEVAQLSNERAEEATRQLQPMTRLFLRRVVQDTWELLRAEMYYLAKSYQYRFLRRAASELYNVESLIRDINKFFTTNGKTSPEQEDFEKAFDAVIQGLFLRLVLELLTGRLQHLPPPVQNHWTVTLCKDRAKNISPVQLQELSQRKRTSFRLHELGCGTGKEHYYRLRYVNFKEIGVTFSEKTRARVPDIDDRISFRITLAHSGESVIRAEDGTFYFFTTRSRESAQNVIQNVRSWGAVYNGKERHEATKGIQNNKISNSDAKLLAQLLTGLGQTGKIVYDEHLPGATSTLTLSIGDNNLAADMEIESLVFEVGWELVDAVEAPRARAHRAGLGTTDA